MSSRILSIAIGILPAMIVLAYAYSQRDDIVSLVISAFIIIILLSLDLYLNLFDYEVYFDHENQEFIFRRFGKEWRIRENKNFDIASYSMFISLGFQYYKFTIGDKVFRFRYQFQPKGFQPFISLIEITKNIKINIMEQINCR